MHGPARTLALPAVLAVLAYGAAGPSEAADRLRLQLKWVPQAQFAGYHAARARGFYAAEGLEVTLRPGGPEIRPARMVADGGAEIGLDWLPSLLAAREQGAPLVNIAQVFAIACVAIAVRVEDALESPR